MRNRTTDKVGLLEILEIRPGGLPGERKEEEEGRNRRIHPLRPSGAIAAAVSAAVPARPTAPSDDERCTRADDESTAELPPIQKPILITHAGDNDQ